MKRQPIHTLDTAGANNGDVPTYDATSGRVIYQAPSGGGSSNSIDGGSPTSTYQDFIDGGTP